MASTSNAPTSLSEKLKSAGQSHLLNFWGELDSDQQQQLADQIEALDFQLIQKLYAGDDKQQDWGELASKAQLPPAITLDQLNGEEYEAAVSAGEAAIGNGEVAMILVAGGQGSRLGFDHPKGMFPIGPISNSTLYEIILQKTLARANQFNSIIPLYIMTSPPTHGESNQFLTENDFFGYGADNVQLFCQGVMPAVDQNGKLLLAEKHSIFVSPDGHGGTLAALDRCGCLNDMKQRGIKHVFYGQVDNPLIQVCDPALIGYHILRQSEMTSQVVRKNDPIQKVGNVVEIDGQVQIIEYSDLPEEYARQTNDDGELKLWAGSIAVHIFDVAFLNRSNANADSLPFHRASKKVPFVDADGNSVEPDSPNATKFEKFIFDLLPSAKNAIICEVAAADGFCAVKNAPPATSETPEHVRQAISDLHSRWLKSNGVSVADGVTVEINALFAVDAKQLAQQKIELKEVTKDTYFA